MPTDPDIYLYPDWRAFVRAWLGARQGRTRDKLAKKLDCSASLLTALLHSEPDQRRNLTDTILERFPRALGLDDEHADHFRLLVHLDRAAPGSESRAKLLSQLHANKRFRDAHWASVEQYELLSGWENVAILAMAESEIMPPDARWIRDHLIPRVQLQEAQRALDLLVRLGLLRLDDQGRAQPTHPTVAVPDFDEKQAEEIKHAQNEARLALHLWMLDRGREALTAFSPDQRFFNAGTAYVPEERLPDLRRLFLRWQAEWMDLCARTLPEQSQRAPDPDGASPRRGRVYRLNLQFFPLSEWINEE